ncbi:MAG: ArsA family ATPase [Myxococcota bacterium]
MSPAAPATVGEVAGTLRQRVLLVTGKGGVGKSSVAAGLAVAGARQGLRVLLVELGARAVLGELLGGKSASHRPKRVIEERYPSLWVAHLDPRIALQEYLSEALKVRSLAKLATENRVLARLWQAAPSVDEMAVLTALERFERARDADDRERPGYDRIVVDMPATGHAKATLAVPRGALGMIRVGSLADRARSVDRMLHDREKTAVIVVTLPEELPANETVQLAHDLDDELDLEVRMVVINAVLARVFDERERDVLNEVAGELSDDAGLRLLAASTRRSERQVLQSEQIVSLRNRLDTEFLEVAFTQAQGVDLVEHISNAVSSSLAEGGLR